MLKYASMKFICIICTPHFANAGIQARKIGMGSCLLLRAPLEFTVLRPLPGCMDNKGKLRPLFSICDSRELLGSEGYHCEAKALRDINWVVTWTMFVRGKIQTLLGQALVLVPRPESLWLKHRQISLQVTVRPQPQWLLAFYNLKCQAKGQTKLLHYVLSTPSPKLSPGG